MRWKNLMAVGLLSALLGCGGEPPAPPKGADKEPPSLDLQTDADAKPAATDEKKDAPLPPADAKPATEEAKPADAKPADAPKGS